MILFTENSPINRAEEATAIKLMAEEYEAKSINITVAQVTIVMDNVFRAGSLCDVLRRNGWHRSTVLSGRYTNQHFVQVPYNAPAMAH